MKMTRQQAIESAVEALGGPWKAATALREAGHEVNGNTVANWLRRGDNIPLEKAAALEKLTGTKQLARMLRPDLDWDLLKQIVCTN